MHFLCSCYKWTLRASSHSHVCEQECLALLGGEEKGRETLCLGRLMGEIERKRDKIYPQEIAIFLSLGMC